MVFYGFWCCLMAFHGRRWSFGAQVAQKTLENFDEFWLCGGCGKVYWEGKMFVKALDHFRSFMPEAERQQELGQGSKGLGNSAK